jgi:hypothetical protein
MLRCLRDVNVDNNTVGWYQSTLMNSWLDPDSPFIETQYEFQCSVPKSVCLIYDPVRTSSGSVHLKAYRLTDKFFKKYKAHVESSGHGFTEADLKPKYKDDYSGKLLEEGLSMLVFSITFIPCSSATLWVVPFMGVLVPPPIGVDIYPYRGQKYLIGA